MEDEHHDERFYNVNLHLKNSCEENQKLVPSELLDSLYEEWTETEVQNVLPPDTTEDLYAHWLAKLNQDSIKKFESLNEDWKEHLEKPPPKVSNTDLGNTGKEVQNNDCESHLEQHLPEVSNTDLRNTWKEVQNFSDACSFKEKYFSWVNTLDLISTDFLFDLKDSSEEIQNIMLGAVRKDLYYEYKKRLEEAEVHTLDKLEKREDPSIEQLDDLEETESWLGDKKLNPDWETYQEEFSNKSLQKLFDSWNLRHIHTSGCFKSEWKKIEGLIVVQRNNLKNCFEHYAETPDSFNEFYTTHENTVMSEINSGKLIYSKSKFSVMVDYLYTDWTEYQKRLPTFEPQTLKKTWEENQKIESASSLKEQYECWVNNTVVKLEKCSEYWLPECRSESLLRKLNDEWEKENLPEVLNLEDVFNKFKMDIPISLKILYELWVNTQNLLDADLLIQLKDDFNKKNQSNTAETLFEDLKIKTERIAKELTYQQLDDSWKMYQECLQIVSIKNLRNTWKENQKIETSSSFKTQYDTWAKCFESNEEFNKLKNSWLLYQKCPTVNLFPSESLYKDWEKTLKESTKGAFKELCDSKNKYDNAKSSTQNNSIETEIGKLRDAWVKNQNIVSSTSLRTLYSTWKNAKQDVPEDLPEDLFDFWLRILTDDEAKSFLMYNYSWKKNQNSSEPIKDLREAWEENKKFHLTSSLYEQYESWAKSKTTESKEFEELRTSWLQYQRYPSAALLRKLDDEWQKNQEKSKELNLEEVLEELKKNPSNSLGKLYESWVYTQNLVDVDLLKDLRTKYNEGNDKAEDVFKKMMTNDKYKKKLPGSFKELSGRWVEYLECSLIVSPKDLRTTWEANQKIELAKSRKEQYDDWKENRTTSEKKELTNLEDSWYKYPKHLSNADFQKLSINWENIRRSSTNDPAEDLVSMLDEKTKNQLPDLLKTLFDSWMETLEENKDSSYKNLIEKWNKYKNGNVLLSDLKKAWEENQKLLLATSLKEVYDSWKKTQKIVSHDLLVDFHDFWLLTLTDDKVDLFKNYNDSWKENQNSSGSILDLREAWEENQKIQLVSPFEEQYDNWAKKNKIEDKLKKASESWIEYQKKVPTRLPKNQLSHGALHAFVGHWKREFSKYVKATISKDEKGILKFVFGYGDETYEEMNKTDCLRTLLIETFVENASNLYDEIEALQFDKNDDLFKAEKHGLQKFKTKDTNSENLHEMKEYEKKFHSNDFKELTLANERTLKWIQNFLFKFVELNATSKNFLRTEKSGDGFLNYYSLENAFGEDNAYLICFFKKNEGKGKKDNFFTISTFYIFQKPSFTFLHPNSLNKFVIHKNRLDCGLSATIIKNWSSFKNKVFPNLNITQSFIEELKFKMLRNSLLKVTENLMNVMEDNKTLNDAQESLLKFLKKNVDGKAPTGVRRVGPYLEYSFKVDDQHTLVLNLTDYGSFDNTYYLYLQEAKLEGPSVASIANYQPIRRKKNLADHQLSLGVLHAFIGHWEKCLKNYVEATISKNKNTLKDIYGYSDEEYEKEKKKDEKFEDFLLEKFLLIADMLYREIEDSEFDKEYAFIKEEAGNLGRITNKESELNIFCSEKEFENQIALHDLQNRIEIGRDSFNLVQNALAKFIQLNATPENFIETASFDGGFYEYHSIGNNFEKNALLVCYFKKYKEKDGSFFKFTNFHVIEKPAYILLSPKYREDTAIVVHTNDVNRGLLRTIKEYWNSFSYYLNKVGYVSNEELDVLNKEILSSKRLYPSSNEEKEKEKKAEKDDIQQKPQELLLDFLKKYVDEKEVTEVRRFGSTMQFSFILPGTKTVEKTETNDEHDEESDSFTLVLFLEILDTVIKPTEFYLKYAYIETIERLKEEEEEEEEEEKEEDDSVAYKRRNSV